MKLAILPETVRVIPRDDKGKPLPDAPVFVCKPIGAMQSAAAMDAVREAPMSGYAQAAMGALVTIEEVDGSPLKLGDLPFDKANERHTAALNPTWLITVGQDLLNRVWLTDEELGKLRSPSD